MSTFKPYRCISIDLAKETNWRESINSETGYYVVLWYHETPVGHLFIEPEEEITPSLFEQKVIRAVSLALKHYANGMTIKVENLHDIIQTLAQALPPLENIPVRCAASVIICTKDRPENLRICLKSLMNLYCKPAEIIVVDNASSDNETRNVSEAFAGVKYVREDRPGLDIARNTGAKAATQPIIMYADDDIRVHPLWVYHVCKTFDDPSVAAMTGLVLASELNTEAQWIFERFWPFNRGFTDKRYDQKFFTSTLTKGCPVWNIGAGANMAFRKKILDAVGYFDERLDVGAAGCNGDSEVWYRILASGHAIQYNPRAVVWHFHRDSMTGFQRQIYYYMRGFTTAVLIQHQRFKHKGNLKHLFIELPKYYAWLLIRGFPFYRGRHRTIWSELRGILSGLIFYIKNRNTPSNIFH